MQNVGRHQLLGVRTLVAGHRGEDRQISESEVTAVRFGEPSQQERGRVDAHTKREDDGRLLVIRAEER